MHKCVQSSSRPVYNIGEQRRRTTVEGFGTYDALIGMSKWLADDYRETDGCIESYAEWIVDWYSHGKRTEDDYHRHLLKEHSSTIRGLIVQRLQARAKDSSHPGQHRARNLN